MDGISIIGLGNMARAIGARALAAGNAVEIIGRDADRARALAGALTGATAGNFGAVPAGDIVILAVPYTSAVSVVSLYGDALAGKIIVDITNPFDLTLSGLTTPDGISAAQEIAKAAPVDVRVVKAFNTVFGHVLAGGGPLDVLIAGDDSDAKARVSVFVDSLGLRPFDTGGLEMAYWLEGAGLLMVNLARQTIGHASFFLGINILG